MTLYCKVKKYTLEGKTANAIANLLGVDNETVTLAMIRMGLWDDGPEEPGEREEAERAQLRADVWGDLADGFSVREVICRYGLSREQFSELLDELMAVPEMKGMPVSHWRQVGNCAGKGVIRSR